MDYVKELEGESGLSGLKGFAIAELRKKLAGKEIAYSFNDLEALLSEEVAELLEEDADAYRTLKGTPFYALLRSGREVYSSQLRRYAQSARLLEGENVEELREKVEVLEQELGALKDAVSEFSTALQGTVKREEFDVALQGLREVENRVSEWEGRLEVLERELRAGASGVSSDEVHSLRDALRDDLSKLRELFFSLEERLYELERRQSSFEELSALKSKLDSLAEELSELKQFKAERSEEEQSLREALAETEPVVGQKRSLLSGNALYVAIAGLAGLIFLVALLVR